MSNTSIAGVGGPALGWAAAGRRVAVFFVLFVAYVGAQAGRSAAVRVAPAGSAGWVSLAAALLLAAALAGIYMGLARSLERRAASELQPKTIQTVAGIVLGLVLFSSVLGVLHVVGVAQWEGGNVQSDVVRVLSASVIAAVGEELIFRGALFRPLEETYGTGAALTVSAVIFGLLHALNPGATVISTASIALEAGVLLGAAYALTRNLWFPIGLHLGWNFTEGGIFGTSVSGGAAGKGIVSVLLVGPTLLTGAKFGPEASIVAIALCLVVAVVFLVFVVRAGRWRPMRRRSPLAAH